MIRRQRIRLPYSYDLYYDVLDLNIGREVTFFGKNFMVILLRHNKLFHDSLSIM